MAKNGFFNSITIAHKYALLLSTETDIYRAWCNYSGQAFDGGISKHWIGTKFEKDVFGMSISKAQNIAIGIDKPKPGDEERIIASIERFKEKLRKKCGNTFPILKDDAKLVPSDLSINDDVLDNRAQTKINPVGENSVWNFATKLGLSRQQAYLAIDRERNCIPKPNCGVFLEDKLAKETFEYAKGVYILILPASSSDSECVSLATLRVSHILPLRNETGSRIRVKLNVPNQHQSDVRFRYQYRGELTPVNRKLSWSITLGQTPYTVELEEHAYENDKHIVDPLARDNDMYDKDNEYPIHLADNAHIQFSLPSSERSMVGLFSSLGQRLTPGDDPSTRLPYSAVVVGRKIYKGDYSEKERKFMREAIGIFGNLDSANETLNAITAGEKQQELEEVISQYKKQCKYCHDRMLFVCPQFQK